MGSKPYTMSDNPNIKSAADRRMVASGQEHEVRYFVKSFDHEFPDRRPEELEAACQQAFDELGTSCGREKLEARAREILTR